jgi:MOSC domain-containing protein YiiM
MLVSNLAAAKLASIQVGVPTSYGTDSANDPHDKPWTTGFYKKPVEGAVFVGMKNIAGDGQADLKHHGGIDKAVLAYSAENYPKWRDELHMPDMPHGAFGENLTITGLNEETVCIGDIFRVGPVIFEVSQPRQPCWKLARRWRMHELVAYVVRNGRTGWYLRVMEEGFIEAGMTVELIERPNAGWTIARANRIMHHLRADLALTVDLANVPRLAKSWVEELRERAERLRTAVVSS